MNKVIYFLLICIVTNTMQSQTIYEKFKSAKLGSERQIKILLPRGYDSKDAKKYPVIYVLDGDYMFEAVAGNADYYAYWEDIPDAIVVGVNQVDTRFDDSMYSEQNSLPIENGANFFEFLGMELVPHINKTYKTEPFKVIVGHGETANFINYYLLKDNPVFQAYITISPDLAPQTTEYLTERFTGLQSKVFYYLATSSNDVKAIKEKTEALDKAITSIDNKNLLYNFNNFEGPSHYSLPAHAIPKALES